MKKSLVVVGLCIASSYAHAQSSVTLFGQIDEALAYINNTGGAPAYRMRSGTWIGSQWGLAGSEDLGNGYRTFFRLENGFDLNTAKLGQGGRLFGRASYLGIGGPFGDVRVGRQYDEVVDYVGPIMANGRGTAPMYDIDNTGNDWATSDAVKYTSPTYKGFSMAAMAASGGVAGQISTNSVTSVGAGYKAGPLQIGAAYTSVRNPYATWFDSTGASSIVTFGAYLPAAHSLNIAAGGVAYTFDKLTARIGVSHSDLTAANNGADVQYTISMGQADYWMTPTLRLAAAIDVIDGNLGSLDQHPKYLEYNLVADYFLSKSTDLYMWAIYGTAGGGATQMQIGQLTASSTASQFNINFGMRYRF
jgi:GBP family porin